jgi:transcriptional regulator GlxA family with amidase domain
MALKDFPHAESSAIDASCKQLAASDPLALAESFMQANISNPIAASNIAAAAGINVRALQRLFRKIYAATPTQVLLQKRIALAREMILSGEARSVRQVAAQLQFSNPARFSKLYSRFHSLTPSHEIRQSRERATGPAKQISNMLPMCQESRASGR